MTSSTGLIKINFSRSIAFNIADNSRRNLAKVVYSAAERAKLAPFIKVDFVAQSELSDQSSIASVKVA